MLTQNFWRKSVGLREERMERLDALEQAVFLIHLPLPSSAEASSKLLTGVYPECLCPLELEFSENMS